MEIVNNYWNYYNNYSTDEKNIERNIEYMTIIKNMLAEMFIVDGMTHDYSTHMIREIIENGSVYVKKCENNKFIICRGNFVGIPAPDEIHPARYIAVKANFQFDGVPNENDGETIVYMVDDFMPFTIINRFSSLFAEVDTSLVNNVMYARIAPVAITANDETKERYEKSVTNMLRGELINSIKTGVSLSTGTPLALSTIDISNGDYANKIQYLSMLHDQLISRLARLFGVNYNFTSKQANITNDELHNSEDLSCIYPVMLKNNLNDCLNKIGLTVKFNKMWEWIEHIAERDTNDNGVIDSKEAYVDVYSEENTLKSE